MNHQKITSKRALFMINLTAGWRKRNRKINKFIRLMMKEGYALEKVFTFKGLKISKDYSLGVICGGDGTISIEADHLLKAGVPIAVLPIGLFNMFRRIYSLSWSAKSLSQCIDKGICEKIAVGRAGDILIVSNISFGYKADAAASIPDWNKRRWGYFSYFYPLISYWWRLQNRRYILRIAEKEVEIITPLLCAIPELIRGVPVLRVYYLRSGNRAIFPLLAFELLLIVNYRRKKSLPGVGCFQVPSLEIETQECFANIDGESYIMSKVFLCAETSKSEIYGVKPSTV